MTDDSVHAADGHRYALLTVGGFEHLAAGSLVAEQQLPVPITQLPDQAVDGIGVLLVQSPTPLNVEVLSAPVVCAALSLVAQHTFDAADEQVTMDAICKLVEPSLQAALQTRRAHLSADDNAVVRSFRVATMRNGRHDALDSRRLSAALGDSIGTQQPAWTVDLETPDLLVLCLLHQHHVLLGLLLPPTRPRRSTALPAEVRSWFVSGSERAHMRPSRAALLVRLLGSQPGDVVLDPTGGVGMLAIEAAMRTSIIAHSLDLDEEACTSARLNAEAARTLLKGEVHVHCADAASLGKARREIEGLPPASVDGCVADLPFGMLHARRLDVGALLSALARLLRPGGRCVLAGNAGKGGVAAAVVKASGRFPRPGVWRVDAQVAHAAGGIACIAVVLTLAQHGAVPATAAAPSAADDAGAAAPPTPSSVEDTPRSLVPVPLG